jgi:hypothetical protein
MTIGDTYVANATQARLRRTIAHELAHGLSLDHLSPCGISSSIMSIPTVCASGCDFTSVYDACTQDGGMTVSPTSNDVLPVKSTYGNGVQAVCGF